MTPASAPAGAPAPAEPAPGSAVAATAPAVSAVPAAPDALPAPLTEAELAAAAEEEAALDAAPERSGRANRIVAIVAGALTVAVLGLWSLSQLGGSSSAIRADTLRFHPEGDSAITLEYHVTAPAGTPLACAIQAQDERHAVVGWDVVELEPVDAPSRDTSARIVTVGPATVVYVKECWTRDGSTR